MLDTCNIHMIKDLVKGLEQHTQRSEIVYQQHIDILKGRLLDRDQQIECLMRELSEFKGGQGGDKRKDKQKKGGSRVKQTHEFQESLRQSRRSLSILFKSKLQQFQNLIGGQKTSRTEAKRQFSSDIDFKKIMIQVGNLRNDKQIYQKQLQAQSKLISQYQQQNTQRVKQLKVYKQKTKQHSKNQTKKIIDLYTQKYKQLICNYSNFFTQLTSFIRNELSMLKKESMQSLGQTWQVLTSSLVKLSQQIPHKNSQYNSRATDQSSILSRQQILEFEIEELRKQLLSIKAENCVMKFQLKRKDEKRFSEAKTQPLFDKNKFFADDPIQNDIKASSKFQKTRKDSSRAGTKRNDRQFGEDIREQMAQIKDKIRNLNNTQGGRRSSSKRKC